MRILVINPGSTSTKIALYENRTAIMTREFQHEKAELAQFPRVLDQKDFRMMIIKKALKDEDIKSATIDAVAGRGGLLRPMEGGVYEVSDTMLHDLREALYGEHPCNLGAILADELGHAWQVPAYIVDPVVTDELAEEARYTGHPAIRRRSTFHALNQRGAARTIASRLGIEYHQANFIVCHMGGGISIGAHRQGKVVEVINALDGEGPFSPERSGSLPLIPVLDMVESGKASFAEMRQTILREGGVFAHLGTNDLREVVTRMDRGEPQARSVFQALAYGIAKYIASLGPALADRDGNMALCAVILTGGLAKSAPLIQEISRLVRYLGPVEIITGDEEMSSLAAGALRVLTGKEIAKRYEDGA
ncbi:butyrate kinase [Pseudodesulfovibrio piezophilus]|uniref:Probable butyrate kinase n=1 Tax=Pseudodesulfovibrio piezophilus (strain DSM 21447 / JCM 15486 / C1TLV30) TaxID=1322246 RepID=M1WX61_PSEP2|nr:butyrate kinase [Pseudodesulfovibrio piezophilus]CCH49533.1 putative butyrate kinase [Pseudodesulfovibrio piezophilus C1TLV30]